MSKTTTEIIASAQVALKQCRQLTDKLFPVDKGMHHTAAVMYYSLESLVTELQAFTSPQVAVESATSDELDAKLVAATTKVREQREALLEKTVVIKDLKEQLQKSQVEQSQLSKQVETQKAALVEQSTRLQEFDALQSTLSETEAALKRSIANAERLTSEGNAVKLKLKEKESELVDTKRKASETLQAEIETIKSRSESLMQKEKQKHQKTQEMLTEQQRENAELAKDLQRVNGVSVKNNRFAGKTKGVEFFIHEYSSPLQLQFQTANLVKQLPKANWHYQVMRSNGVSINVAPTVWCTPVLPECSDFQDEWNMDISNRLHELMLARAKESHPREYARTVAAKNHPITTNPLLTEVERKALQKAKLITLFDSISMTYTAFENQLTKYNKKMANEECIALRVKIEMICEDFIESADKKHVHKPAKAA